MFTVYIVSIAVLWALLSATSIGFAIWGWGASRLEQEDCETDLLTIKDIPDNAERLTLAKNECEQATRKKKVMRLFVVHQILFLIAGGVAVMIPVTLPTVLLVGFVLGRQIIIVWSHLLLTINLAQRQELHARYGLLDRVARKEQ